MWIFLLVIIRNCVKSWPYSADAMDIMDVVQRLKKGNNQLLRWVIDNFVYSFFSFGCIVQNGDFSQELIHRSRKMTSFLYYTRSCRCFQQSHAAMIRTRMFQLNLRVRCQFQQSKRFSPVFFSCLRYSKIKLFLLRSPLISCYFFVLSSPFGNNNKRRSRQFITDENQLRRVVVPPVRGTGPLGCFLMDGNNMAKQQQQQQQPH